MLGLYWFPPNINSAYGAEIDHLYAVILWIVGILFVGTQAALLYFLFRYRGGAGRKAEYTHGNNTAEAIWTVIPGLILVWLALYQSGTWATAKENFPSPEQALVVQILPEQFGWNFRYAGPDGAFGTDDDIATSSLHVPVNRKVVFHMSSKDVIHSFFVPYARTKQDVIPGMLTKAWFALDHLSCWDLKENRAVLMRPEQFDRETVAIAGYQFESKTINDIGQKEYNYRPFDPSAPVRAVRAGQIVEVPPAEIRYVLHSVEIACAELCGLGHFRMRASLYIEPEAVFNDWLARNSDPTQQLVTFNTHWDTPHPEFNK